MKPDDDAIEAARGRPVGTPGPLFDRRAPELTPDRLAAVAVAVAAASGPYGMTSDELRAAVQKDGWSDPGDLAAIVIGRLAGSGSLTVTDQARAGRRVVVLDREDLAPTSAQLADLRRGPPSSQSAGSGADDLELPAVPPAPAATPDVAPAAPTPAQAPPADQGPRQATPAGDVWGPSVPFPAEDLGECRGCGASIGWIRRADDGRAHPVEALGIDGAPVPAVYTGPRPRSGWTLEGAHARVVRPPADLPRAGRVVIFESHFGLCPKASRFGRRSTKG